MKKLEPTILKIKLPQTQVLLKIGYPDSDRFRGLENSKLLGEIPERLQFNVVPMGWWISKRKEKVQIDLVGLSCICSHVALGILEKATLEEKEGIVDYILLPGVVSSIFKEIREYAKENEYELV